ncbi:MAG: hypothetical protein AB7O59_06825 [Pirellulales bacterium]
MSKAADELAPGKAIMQLVVEAENEAKGDRRTIARFPFFRPVWIRMPGAFRRRAFSREISAEGIGLIHDFDIPPGEVELSILSRDGYLVVVTTRIDWCRFCGDDWHISGGEFVRLGGVGQ